MKTKKSIAIYVATVILCFTNRIANAQWQVNFNGGDVWGQTIPTSPNNVQSIGIGDFFGQSPLQTPLSALHINTYSSYLPPSPSFGRGEVFRTESPSGADGVWRMITGNGSNGEKFNVTNPDATNDIYLGTVMTGDFYVYTDGIGNPRVTVLGSNGNVGIGNTFTPTYKLDVDQGDINLNQTLTTGIESYRINGVPVLWHNQNTSNIFVGAGAGAATNASSTGINNTFVGNNSGQSNTTGVLNTFIGFEAGASTTSGDSNTYIGGIAGTDNTTGSENTAVGWSAGEDNTTGFGNSSLGYQAGDANVTGNFNTSVGYRAGDAASNDNGRYNTMLGSFARPWTLTTNHHNATAVGANALADCDDCMVLGSIAPFNADIGHTIADINVGIGVTAPATRLEVRDASGTSPQLRLTYGLSPAIQSDFLTTAAGDLLINPSNAGTSTNVGINLSVANPPIAKLHVRNNTETRGALIQTSTGGSLTYGLIAGSRNATSNEGVHGQAHPITFPTVATVGTLIAPVIATPYNVGVVGQAQDNNYNFGGIFEANMCGTNINNYGVYASAKQCTAGLSNAGYFQGTIARVGPTIDISDSTFKDSIQPLVGALAIISRLHPKNYVFKTGTYQYMNLPFGKQFGLISQQVDTVLPELVHDVMQPQIRDTAGTVLQDTITFKGMDYGSLIPITIRAIQELDSLQGTKLTSCTGSPAANNLTKWDTVSHVLCTSVIYDDGNRIGIPTVDAHAYVNVVIASDTISAGRFEAGQQGVYGLANGNNDMQAGVIGESKNAGNTNVGVIGLAINATDSVNAGVLGDAENSNHFNVGGIYTSQSINTTAHNVAVYGIAAGSSNQNVGGRFEATDTVGVNYGLFATTGGSSTAGFAGYFDGDVHATGTVTWTSDQNLKTNVRNINSNDALASILKLEPKNYEYRTADYPYLNLARGNQYGLLAQDVQQVLPELVSDITQPERLDKNGKQQSPRFEYKGLNYVGIIPVLIGAVKELKGENDSLKQVINDRLNAMEERLNNCCRAEGSRKTDDTEGSNTAPPANEKGTQVNHMSVELSSMQVIVLEQNVPNPFAEQTSISYFVPENMNNAQIIFTDMLGTVIKTADIKTGYGVMTVFASNLSTGQYSYTLLVDGKTIETKKMVKSK